MLSIGTLGDVRPMILLGQELVSRGHVVRIAAFKPLCKTIENAGLEFYCLPGDVHDFIAQLMKPGSVPITFLSRLTKSLGTLIRPLVEALYVASRGADALALTYFGSIGYSIAEKLHIPCFQLHFYPMDRNADVPLAIMPMLKLGKVYNNLTYSISYLAVSGLEYAYLHRWRKINGMHARRIRPNPDYSLGKWKIPVMYAISPQLFMPARTWPDNIHMVGFFQPTATEKFDPPSSLVNFLNEGTTPIYIGFGSMVSGDMRELLTVILQTLARLHVRAIISRGWGILAGVDTINAPTDNVYFADFVPHSWLFERVSAVVHHGGAGTTAAGLYAGLPTLVIPFGGDQPFWGNQVYKRGLGPRPLPRMKVNHKRLARSLLLLTTNSIYKKNAAYIAKHLRMENGQATAADIIERESLGFKDFMENMPEVRKRQLSLVRR